MHTISVNTCVGLHATHSQIGNTNIKKNNFFFHVFFLFFFFFSISLNLLLLLRFPHSSSFKVCVGERSGGGCFIGYFTPCLVLRPKQGVGAHKILGCLQCCMHHGYTQTSNTQYVYVPRLEIHTPDTDARPTRHRNDTNHNNENLFFEIR